MIKVAPISSGGFRPARLTIILLCSIFYGRQTRAANIPITPATGFSTCVDTTTVYYQDGYLERKLFWKLTRRFGGKRGRGKLLAECIDVKATMDVERHHGLRKIKYRFPSFDISLLSDSSYRKLEAAMVRLTCEFVMGSRYPTLDFIELEFPGGRTSSIRLSKYLWQPPAELSASMGEHIRTIGTCSIARFDSVSLINDQNWGNWFDDPKYLTLYYDLAQEWAYISKLFALSRLASWSKAEHHLYFGLKVYTSATHSGDKVAYVDSIALDLY